MKILFVIPSLDYGGAARQLTLIAEGLPRDRFRRASASSAGAAPWAEELRAAGVEVDVLGWKRPFEPAPFLALRRLTGRAAARRGSPVGPHRPARRRRARPASAAPAGCSSAPPCRRDAARSGSTAGCCAGPTSSSPSARPRPTAAAASASGRSTSPSSPPACGRPPRRPLPAELPRRPAAVRRRADRAHKGFRDAVWALDILHYLYEDLRLSLAGGGPDRPRVERSPRPSAWPTA